MSTRVDSTLRPICFGIDKRVSQAVAASQGPEKFKRYEHALYMMGQFARITYCDTGIIWKTIEAGLGRSSDIVNGVITAYDAAYIKERRAPLTSQTTGLTTKTTRSGTMMLPHESYALSKAPTQGAKYATYISSPDNVICLITEATAGKGRLLPAYNKHSTFLPSDVIVAFKGSSTMVDFKHDVLSQLSMGDLGKMIKSTGITVSGSDNIVTGSFIKPLMGAWSAIIQGLTDHVKQPNTRLFITGQSLGGAYCTLFGFILAEAVASQTGPAVLRNIKSIHVVSFGSPTTVYAGARNTFNRHLDSGIMTLDRVVSQWKPMRSTAIQGAVIGLSLGAAPGALFGPQDGIPTIPFGFVHPGYRPLTTNVRPEANGRPYSLDYVRKFYGIQTKSRYRDPQTWPFSDEVTIVNKVPYKSDIKWDTRNHPTVKIIVEAITGTTWSDEPEVTLPAPQAELIMKEPESTQGQEDLDEDPVPQSGGLKTLFNRSQKSSYSKMTQTHIPNFLSVEGNHRAHIFAHAEYLGMFYAGVFRFAGMLNPTPAGSGKCGFFEIFPTGVKIQYLDQPKQVVSNNVTRKAVPVTVPVPVPVQAVQAKAKSRFAFSNPFTKKIKPQGGKRRKSSKRKSN